jgi:hypothetical protein
MDWVGHHGDNHRQCTRIELVPAQKENPILKGVPATAFCHAGGYVGQGELVSERNEVPDGVKAGCVAGASDQDRYALGNIVEGGGHHVGGIMLDGCYLTHKGPR